MKNVSPYNPKLVGDGDQCFCTATPTMNTAEQTRNGTILNAGGIPMTGGAELSSFQVPPDATAALPRLPIEREEPHIAKPFGRLYWRCAQSERSKSNMAKRAIEVTLCSAWG
ncbi:MAG: hypothetical protein ACLQDV_06590 [Candidatus Binataceae bacterium]